MLSNMGRKKDTLEQRSTKMTQRRRYRYDKTKPFIELLKPEYQRWLIVGDIARELKSLLHNGDAVDVRTLTFLDFRLTEDETDDTQPCTHRQIYQWLAKLLEKTGSKGTRYGKDMIFRYICGGHSNLLTDELSLKTSVNRELKRASLTKV